MTEPSCSRKRRHTVKLWDAATGQLVHFRGHSSSVRSVAFSATKARDLRPSAPQPAFGTRRRAALRCYDGRRRRSGLPLRRRDSSTPRPKAPRCDRRPRSRVFGIDQFYRGPLPPRSRARLAGVPTAVRDAARARPRQAHRKRPRAVAITSHRRRTPRRLASRGGRGWSTGAAASAGR